jgi:3-oxoacyl-[acyl-carrier-protein] synthase-3
MRKSRILGTGSELAENKVSNHDLAKIVDTNDEWIVSRTGIETRYFASPETSTSGLATKAAKKALEAAGIDAADIDLIIVATITPDMGFPATACLVQEQIGAVKAAAFDLEAACSGFIYGMAVADQFISTGFYNHVLVIGAETMSRILDMKDRNTCVLFGDGAGAVVMGPAEGDNHIKSFHLGADGSGGKFLYMPAGGSKMPSSHETVDNRLHFVKMGGTDVFKFAVRTMESSSLTAVEKAGLEVNQIDYMVPHQANIRIIQAAAKKLNLPMEKVQVNLNHYGNMSAASIPVALDEAFRENKFKKDDHVLLVGFGAGLTWASCVIKW